MITFATSLSVAYIAVALLASGAGHVLRFGAFRALVRSHGVVPDRWSTLAAGAVLGFEVLAGLTALLLSVSAAGKWPAAVLFGLTAVGGACFVHYVRRLLLRGPTVAGCGCTPLGGPVTRASLLPGGALSAVSVIGLAATAAAAVAEPGPAVRLLPQLAGATLACAVMLVPAAMALDAPMGGRA